MWGVRSLRFIGGTLPSVIAKLRMSTTPTRCSTHQKNISSKRTNFIKRGFSSRSSTIFALCSGFVKSGVAVIRVSGRSSLNIIHSMTPLRDVQHARANVTSIFHPVTQKPIDKGIVLFFKGPRSFTGSLTFIFPDFIL